MTCIAYSFTITSHKCTTAKFVAQGPRDTGRDNDDDDRPNFDTVFGYMRREDVINDYVHLVATLIRPIITYRKFKMNRTTSPFSEWVSISDEAFLLICLDNYSLVWRHEKLLQTMGNPPDENTVAPLTRYTGKDKGTRNSWSDMGIQTFEQTMMRVHRDRQRHGKKFDALFLEYMKDQYERKPKPAPEHELGEKLAKKKRQPILSDFNIKEFMKQRGDRIVDRLEENDANGEVPHDDSDNDDGDDDDGVGSSSDDNDSDDGGGKKAAV